MASQVVGGRLVYFFPAAVADYSPLDLPARAILYNTVQYSSCTHYV